MDLEKESRISLSKADSIIKKILGYLTGRAAFMDPDLKELMEVLRKMQEGEGMSNMSIFTDYLKILADYSGKVDVREVTYDDYVGFQQLKDRIIKAYQRGCFRKTEHDALTTIYYYLHDGFRVVLQLDPPEQGPQQGE